MFEELNDDSALDSTEDLTMHKLEHQYFRFSGRPQFTTI